MRTRYRALTAAALSLPLVLGVSGTALADTEVQSPVHENAAAVTVPFQNQDEDGQDGEGLLDGLDILDDILGDDEEGGDDGILT